MLYIEIGVCDETCGKFARIGTILVERCWIIRLVGDNDSQIVRTQQWTRRRPGGLKSKGSGSLPVKIRGICRFLASSNPVKPLSIHLTSARIHRPYVASLLSLSLSEAIVATRTDTRALCRDACAHPRGHFTNYREGSGATIGKSIGGIFIFIEWWRLNRRGSIRVRMAD